MKIFKNAVDNQILRNLIDYFSQQPITNTRLTENKELMRIVKHSCYDDTKSIVYQELNPLLNALIGPHKFTGGHFLDAHLPFLGHFDTYGVFANTGVHQFDNTGSAGLGCLIPLSENQHFHTVFFDYLLPDDLQQQEIKDIDPEYLTARHDQRILDLIDHHPQCSVDVLMKLPIDNIAQWHMGDILVWDRRQLHCSSNFAKYGLNKQALVLWV